MHNVMAAEEWHHLRLDNFPLAVPAYDSEPTGEK